MRLTRVLLPAPLIRGALVTLPITAARHLVRVLRLEPGDALAVFDGEGHEFHATLENPHKDQVQVRVGEVLPRESESPLSITLLQGIARGEKMDLILQKATELGVTRIVPVAAARSTVRLDEKGAAKRHAHWQGVLASACEQSGRSRLPGLEPVTELESALQAGAATLPVLLVPTEDAQPLPLLLQGVALQGGTSPSISLLVGPEGGFDEREVQLAQLAGFRACRLGPRVLRTETAALAALAALQVLIGDWR